MSAQSDTPSRNLPTTVSIAIAEHSRIHLTTKVRRTEQQIETGKRQRHSLRQNTCGVCWQVPNRSSCRFEMVEDLQAIPPH
jgi:hypothetical protein